MGVMSSGLQIGVLSKGGAPRVASTRAVPPWSLAPWLGGLGLPQADLPVLSPHGHKGAPGPGFSFFFRVERQGFPAAPEH